MHYAGRVNRILAAFVDWVILGLIAWSFWYLTLSTISNILVVAWVNYFFDILWIIAYLVVFQSYMGQTLGKKALGIKIVDSSDKKPSMWIFFLREIFGLAAASVWFGLGLIWFLWDKRRQGWQDKIAETFVVKA
jgi:uncharacterized RDD family membrane protein YckC